jgi:hypothetical protein
MNKIFFFSVWIGLMSACSNTSQQTATTTNDDKSGIKNNSIDTSKITEKVEGQLKPIVAKDTVPSQKSVETSKTMPAKAITPAVAKETSPKQLESVKIKESAAISNQQVTMEDKVKVQKDPQEADERIKRQQIEITETKTAEKEAIDKFKGRFGKSGGNHGTGTGRGDTDKPGNQGAPDGDPNLSVLTDVGKGAGVVNGFGGRGVRTAPKFQEQAQKSAKVVLDVCIDGDGNVLSVRFNSRLSNTPDPELQQAAISNAKQYKFVSGIVDKLCGMITYNFIGK